MKLPNVFLLVLCALAVVSGCARVSVAYGSAVTVSPVAEGVDVYVNCTSSQVTVDSTIASDNTSLIHFPSSLNMNDPNLLNVTTVFVAFAASQSSLVYVFNNTDPATAKSSADEVTPNVETAFQTTFSFVSTGVSGSVVNVTYSGSGKASLSEYTSSLMSKDLYSGLGGVSSTFLPMSIQTNAVTGMVGTKAVGTFDWTYGMLVSYLTSIPVGSGNHVVDILNLLSVGSIAPSSFAYSTEAYASEVAIYVVSNGTVSYVSSQPGLAVTTGSRGWSYYPLGTNEIAGAFSFGNDASATNVLTFTFGGTVLPEFPPTALLLVIMLATTVAMMLRKRIRKMRSETTPSRKMRVQFLS